MNALLREADGHQPSVRAVTLDLAREGSDPLTVVVVEADPGELPRIAAEWNADTGREAPAAWAAVPELPRTADGAVDKLLLANRVRAGEIVAVTPAAGGRLVDAGPRAVDGVPWVRLIRLPLGPHNRGSVNAVLLDADEGVVVIDAGLAEEAPRLARALAIAGIPRGGVRAVLCTHLHADHVGGAAALRRDGWLADGGRILLGRSTERLGRAMFVDRTSAYAEQLLANGVPADEIPRWVADLGVMAQQADWPDDVALIRDGDSVTFGPLRIEVRDTPGHCPDHLAFRVARDGHTAVLLGDMTLGRAMPRCGVRDWERPDPIADMIASWNRLVEEAPDAVGVPAHGAPIPRLAPYYAELDGTIRRAIEAFRVAHAGAEVTAGDLMNDIVGSQDGWGPRMFAFYDSLAMLRHLAAHGSARVVSRDPDRYHVEQL